MRILRLVVLGVTVACIEAGFGFSAETSSHSTSFVSAADKKHQQKNTLDDSDSEQYDDLEWLVGRWKCVARQFLKKDWSDHYLPSQCRVATLEYFNVYYPYADERQTLALPEEPFQREIAAEFLCRVVRCPFEEALCPLDPHGQVWVGRNRIWYGYVLGMVEFKVELEKHPLHPKLIFNTGTERLIFLKLCKRPGELGKSWVNARIRKYSSEKLKNLKKRYEQLKQQHQQGKKQGRAKNTDE